MQPDCNIGKRAASYYVYKQTRSCFKSENQQTIKTPF
jgi:hypothetical protein